MKKNYLLPALLLLFAVILNSCTSNDNGYNPVSPVVLDVTQVPYAKLSDYKFFVGDMKDLEPAYKVIPYKPNSDLFSDYAHKKRFVWMPEGSQSTYNGDDNVLEFPVGAVLIKNFYYDNVQPGNYTRIIETRLLVKVSATTDSDSGWKMYDYIWNEEQTDADLDTNGNGMSVPITWTENGVTKSTNYKVPSATECITCHKINLTGSDELIIPIGVKPQNLNYTYDYGTSTRNQLQKWQNEGYLDNSVPEFVNTVVDWRDTSKPLELRARSYMDINCAHCHRTGGHCDYVNLRLNFSNNDDSTYGICMTPVSNIDNLNYVIAAGSFQESELGVRINSSEESVMMPIIGRTLVHEEGVQLIKDWINSLDHPCE